MSIDGGLRPMFRERLREGFHWTSIESGDTAQGVPDSNFCCGGREGWVEYKKTATYRVEFRPGQVAWHMERHRRGGWSLVAVRRTHSGGPRKGDPEDQLWLFPGRTVLSLQSVGLSETQGVLGVWSGGPSHWDWLAVRECLLRGY